MKMIHNKKMLIETKEWMEAHPAYYEHYGL